MTEGEVRKHTDPTCVNFLLTTHERRQRRASCTAWCWTGGFYSAIKSHKTINTKNWKQKFSFKVGIISLFGQAQTHIHTCTLLVMRWT